MKQSESFSKNLFSSVTETFEYNFAMHCWIISHVFIFYRAGNGGKEIWVSAATPTKRRCVWQRKTTRRTRKDQTNKDDISNTLTNLNLKTYHVSQLNDPTTTLVDRKGWNEFELPIVLGKVCVFKDNIAVLPGGAYWQNTECMLLVSLHKIRVSTLMQLLWMFTCEERCWNDNSVVTVYK